MGSRPQLKIEYRSTEQLIPYARNARIHDPAQIDQIAASIRDFGWTNPVLIDESDVIIAGHGRVMAARQLGLTQVPVIVLRGLSEAQRRAYAIADNKLALNSEWDEDALRAELAELQDLSLESIGFSSDEISDLFANSPETFEFPDAPESVQENVAAIEQIKTSRRNANKGVEQKNDTEHYLVIVFATRAEREAVLRRLGLPEDERYILGRAVELKPRFGGRNASIKADRAIKAAEPSKSGAGG